MTPENARDGRTPLTYETGREATASMRGYDYQILRSLEAWIALKPSQTLWLEAAEDFDTTEIGVAVATQIKSSAKPVSLRSKDASKAVEHLFSLVKSNPTVDVRLQFLTQGTVAQEQDSPLAGIAGIDAWRMARAGNTEVLAPLRCLLRAIVGLDSDCGRFLESASDESFGTCLLSRLDWVTEEPDEGFVAKKVRRMLIAHAEEKNILTTAGEQAFDGLFQICRGKATRINLEDRSLTREDFLVEFTRLTSAVIPLTQDIGERLKQVFSASLPRVGDPQLEVTRRWRLGVPALPDPVMFRRSVVGEISNALATGQVAIIGGTEGRGKTTLTKLVARDIDGPCAWLDVSGRDSQTLDTALDELAFDVEADASIKVVVVDDIDFAGNIPHNALASLRMLVHVCRNKTKALILSAKGAQVAPLDSRVLEMHGRVFEVPDVQKDELVEYLIQLGCSEPARSIEQRASVTLLHSGGHPSLACFSAIAMKQLGWPKITAEDLLRVPQPVQTARQRARLDAARALPDPERDFLYAITVSNIWLSRSAAIRLGAEVSQLTAPGDALDRLNGRWLERDARSGYKASSLLSGAAVDAWPSNRLEDVHRAIFSSVIADGTLNVSDALLLFLHALLSKSHEHCVQFSRLVHDAKGKVGRQLAEELRPILTWWPTTDDLPFKAYPSVNWMLRFMQFRVASKLTSELIDGIASLWEQELKTLPDGDLGTSSKALYAMSIVLDIKSPISPARTVRALAMLFELRAMGGTSAEVLSSPSLIKNANDNYPETLLGSLFTLSQQHCTSASYLNELLDALVDVDADVRSEMLTAFDSRREFYLLEGVWLEGRRVQSQDWEPILAVMHRAFRLAADEWSCQEMAIRAARVIAIIFDEECGRRDDAADFLRSALDAFPEAPRLIEQQANLHFQHNEFREALDIWAECLTESVWSQTDAPIVDHYAFRRAGLAASELSDDSQASMFFRQGGDYAKLKNRHTLAAGFWIDASLSAWKAGQYGEMQMLLLKALPLLEEPADAEVDISRFLTQRLAAFVVSHMAQRYQRVATGESGVPIPGMCSAPDKATWDIPRNIVPFSVVIAQAAQLEFALGLDSLCEKQFARALETRNPATEFLLVTLAVKRSFRDASFGELPSLAVRQSRVVSAAKLVNNGSNVFANVETVSAENEPLDELAESLIFAGLAIGMLMGLEPAMVISEWRNRTDAVVLARCSLALERAHSAFSQSPIDAVLAIYDQAKPLVIRLAACSVLLNQKERSPAHTVNTQVLLLQIFRQCLSTETIVELLPKLATAYGQHWALHVDQHATLVQPRISVPPLRAIISAQPVHPGKHVAALIRAGCEAAGQRAYQPLLAWLNDLPT